MSDKIIDIRSRQPHLQGPAVCLQCRHTWQAVCEVGIVHGIQCPACKLYKGVFEALTGPDTGHLYLECNCGNHHFMIVEGFACCALCGMKQVF